MQLLNTTTVPLTLPNGTSLLPGQRISLDNTVWLNMQSDAVLTQLVAVGALVPSDITPEPEPGAPAPIQPTDIIKIGIQFLTVADLAAALPFTVEGLTATFANWMKDTRTNIYTASHLLDVTDKSAWVHMNSASPTVVTLPKNWGVSQAAGIKRLGTGAVTWATESGATIQLPDARAGHVGISQQYDEIFARVIANSGGNSAVWSITGTTA